MMLMWYSSCSPMWTFGVNICQHYATQNSEQKNNIKKKSCSGGPSIQGSDQQIAAIKTLRLFEPKTNSLGKCSWQPVPVKPGGLANTKFITIMIQWISSLSILQWIVSISWFWLRKVVNMRWPSFLSHILVLAPTQHFHPSHALPTQLFPTLEYPPPPFTDLEFSDHPVVQLRRNHLHKK